MCDDRRQLRFVVDESHQSSGDVDRAVRESEGVRLRVAERAKFPRHLFELQPSGNQRLPDATQISIRRVVCEHQAVALEPNVKEIRLLEHLHIDIAEFKFFLYWRRRGLDGRSLLLREGDGTE